MSQRDERLNQLTAADIERFWSHTNPLSNGCRIWRLSKNHHGYGVFSFREGSWVAAHRAAWWITNGPIPEGMEVDHCTCFNRACVEPSHLRLLAQTVNAVESPAHNKYKTHCPAGHPYDATNTIWRTHRGRRERQCRMCKYLQRKP